MRLFAGMIGTAVLAAVVGCAPTGGAADDAAVAEVRQAIEQANTEVQEAFRQGDADAVARLFTEDGMYMPNGSPTVSGRDNVRRFLTPIFNGATVTTYALTTTELEVYGNTAYEFGNYQWESVRGASSDTTVDQGRYAAVRRRGSGGAWLIYRLLENTSPRPHPSTTMP